jgi:hypothetical protein
MGAGDNSAASAERTRLNPALAALITVTAITAVRSLDLMNPPGGLTAMLLAAGSQVIDRVGIEVRQRHGSDLGGFDLGGNRLGAREDGAAEQTKVE